MVLPLLLLPKALLALLLPMKLVSAKDGVPRQTPSIQIRTLWMGTFVGPVVLSHPHGTGTRTTHTIACLAFGQQTHASSVAGKKVGNYYRLDRNCYYYS